MSEATIITGKLKDDALRNSIDSLVKYVDGSVNGMAERFNTALGSMSASMREFAITQGASVTAMKRAWRDMAATFDGFAAVQTAKTGGSSSTASSIEASTKHDTDAVKKEIAVLEELRQKLAENDAVIRKAQTSHDGWVQKMHAENDALKRQEAELTALKAEQQALQAAEQQSLQAKQQKLQVDAQVAAKEKEIAEAKRKVADAEAGVDAAEKMSQGVKEKSLILLSQIEAQEKKVAEAKQQTSAANMAAANTAREVAAEQQKATSALQRVMEMPESTGNQMNDKRDAIKSLLLDTEKTDEAAKQLQAEYVRLKNALAELEGRSVRKSQVAVQGAKEEAKAIQEVENVMGSMPKEMRMPGMAKSARDSFAVFFKDFNEQARALEQKIQQEENRLVQSLQARVSALGQQIDQTKAKIQELRDTAQQLSKEEQKAPAEYGAKEGYRAAIQQTNEEIQKLIAKVRELEETQRKVAALDPLKQQSATLEKLWEEYIRVSAAMGETAAVQQKQAQAQQNIAQAQKDATQAVQQQTQAQQQQSAEVGATETRFNRLYAAYNAMFQKREALFSEGDINAANELDKKIERMANILRNYFNLPQGMVERMQDARLQIEAMEKAASGDKARRHPQTFSDFNDLRDAIAHVMNIERQEVKMVDEETASRKKLQATLKQLKSAYDELSKSYRASDNGEALLATIHSYERALQKLNMSQKSDLAKMDIKNTLGLEARTLDEIAYKIQQLNSMKGSFNIFDRAQLQQIHEINRELERLKLLQQEAGQKKFGEIMMIPERSIVSMRQKISELENHKINLSSKSDVDRILRINNEIDRLNQKISSLNKGKALSLKDIIAIQPKDLDEMAHKVQLLQQYRGKIDITSPDAAQKIKEVNDVIDAQQKKLDELMNKNRSLQKEDEKTRDGVLKSWNYIRNRLAYMLTVGAAMNFTKNVIAIRSEYELLERSIGTLVDSARQGSEIFRELNEMALKSPFTLIELGGAAKQLTAYDIAAKDVVETTRRLGDLAAAAGINIDRLTYSLGHIKSFGYLNSRDARMFATAGIPLVKELADMYSEVEGRMVSMMDVYDRIKKKAVDFNDVMAVMNKMTDEGGKYFNFQEKVSGTLKVQLANLTLAWNNMLNDIGKSGRGLIYGFISGVKAIVAGWKTLRHLAAGVVVSLVIMKGLVPAFSFWFGKAKMELAQMNILARSLVVIVRSIKSVFSSLFSPKGIIGFAIAAIGVLVSEWMSASQLAKDIGKSFTDSIKEDLDSIKSYTKEYGNTLLKASAGALSQSEGQKAWERMREEIEKTSAAGADYATKLENGQSDVNKRIVEGALYLEDMQKILKDLDDNTNLDFSNIKVTTDTLLGLLGEGLEEDLEDFTERFTDLNEEIRETGITWEQLMPGEKGRLTADAVEAADEIADSFEEVRGKIVAAASSYDDLALRQKALIELVERWKRAVLINNPNITGAGRELFDVQVDKITSGLAKDLGVSYDENARNWKIFLKTLGDSSGDFFKGWSAEQVQNFDWASHEGQKFITDALDKIKRDHIPSVYDAIKQMVADANQLKINIPVYWNVIGEVQTEMMKRFNKDFQPIAKGSTDALLAESLDSLHKGDIRGAFEKFLSSMGIEARKAQDTWEKESKKYAFLVPSATDDYTSYEKNLQDQYASITTELEKLIATKKTETDQESLDALNESIELHTKQKDAIIAVANAWGLKYEKEKKDKGGGRKEEDLIAEALRTELSILKDVQSNYDKLRKEGVDDMNAIRIATQGYEHSLLKINATLGKFGIPSFDLSDFAGKNVIQVLDKLKEQRNALLASGKVKLQSLKELDVEIQRLNVEVEEYKMQKLVDGLNNELGKLKEEYEISLDIDANPELNDMFADMFGIDTSSLARSFSDYMKSVERSVDKFVQGMGKDPYYFDIMQTDISKWAEKNAVDAESNQVKALQQWQKTLRDMFRKNMEETEKSLDDYVKKYGNLSDKIAEIEADRLQKIKKLNDTYYTEEMRSRTEYAAKLNAINKGAEREVGTARFEDFKESELYVKVFENLEYVSRATLESMKRKLSELRNELGKLSPEQVKQVAEQMEKIDKELIKRNPFKGLIKNARNYVKAIGSSGKKAQKAFSIAQENYDNQLKIVTEKKKELELVKAEEPFNSKKILALAAIIGMEEIELEHLKEILEKAEAEANKFDLMRKVFGEQARGIADFVSVVAQNLQSLGELRDYLRDTFGVELPAEIDGVIDGLVGVGEGLNQITSSAQSGDVVGVITGTVKTVTGLGDAIASAFGGGGAKTKKLNKEIKKSQEEVRKLGIIYNELERKVEKAMGAEEIRARRAAIANKEQQLAEVKRQLLLEQSKRKKDRDEEAIKQYQEQIQELQNEKKDLADDIVSTLLGSDIKSAAEDFVQTWVDAWKAGEDAMAALETRFDDMIDTMIMKSLASAIVSKRLKKIYDKVDEFTKEDSRGGEDLTLEEIREIQSLKGMVTSQIHEELKALYGDDLGYMFGASGDASLSALQQGIQGITEETAGALEAYMNSVSQQVYYQSDVLTQIRDAVVVMNADVSLATQSQMLLQMQQSYQVQMAIQAILSGWSSPSGMAVRVEMV